LDEIIEQRRKTTKEEIKRELEQEQKLLNMDGPWGKPGPGGTIWRHPRNIGLNFSKSMGWTDNEIFSKLKGDQRGVKLSSLTLPKVKRDDDTYGETPDKENIKPSLIDKLPHISYNDSPTGSGRDRRREMDEKVKAIYGTNRKYKRSPKKKKFIKRLSNGDKVSRVCLDEYDNYIEGDVVTQKKLTPEANILRVTGGIELVPLLARRRRVGARTLPSSDVTRPPDQPCQWRELQVDYLRELKRQMRVKCEQKEESRRNSAESVKQHHATWASLWGRPGHGAPQQRGRYARSNLAQLLYVQPLSNTQ
ncbi:uncharacterized protein LOC115445868, partial [Manduca sexta]|uniref:uncharacterized protein LOC115445868 n=1 Tax=Manduca sexta TaxID=7130 RepID=UPI00188FD6DE